MGLTMGYDVVFLMDILDIIRWYKHGIFEAQLGFLSSWDMGPLFHYGYIH